MELNGYNNLRISSLLFGSRSFSIRLEIKDSNHKLTYQLIDNLLESQRI
jgi:hypothetical protein